MMLPWYMGSTLFQHATHLLPLYNVRQILHHDLEKCLKACVLLKNLRYTKSPSQKPYIQIFFKSIRIYRVLKKVKIQSYCKPFTKICLTAFSFVVNITAVTSAFLHRPEPLNHLLIAYNTLFHSSKDPCSFIDICVVHGINFLL